MRRQVSPHTDDAFRIGHAHGAIDDSLGHRFGGETGNFALEHFNRRFPIDASSMICSRGPVPYDRLPLDLEIVDLDQVLNAFSYDLFMATANASPCSRKGNTPRMATNR